MVLFLCRYIHYIKRQEISEMYKKIKRINDYPLYKHQDFTNFSQLIEEKSKAAPDQIAFQYIKHGKLESVAYLQFQQDIHALEAFLNRQGFHNTKIALLGENSYEWILCYFAVVMDSNIIVPLDKEMSSEEIGALLAHSDAEVLISSDTYADIAEAMLAQGKVSRTFHIADFPDYLNSGRQLIFSGDYIPGERNSDENSVCSIIFTSGTTGKPKGVMLSQRGLMSDAVNSCRNVYFTGASLLTLPLHHTFAFTAGVLVMLVYGCTICISRSLRTFRSDLQIFKPRHMFLVPLFVENLYKTIWAAAREQGKEKLLKRMVRFSHLTRKCGIDLRKKLFHSILEQFGGHLELVVSGGAPITQKYVDGLDDIGIQVLNGYGITECSPVIAVNRNRCFRRNSVGLPIKCCEVKIVGGEICAKGPNIMLGYYRGETMTKEVIQDGWFKTGDLGYIDGDGFLYITGRKKSLIILSNGENISPEELEDKIQGMDPVNEVLVYAESGKIAAEIFGENEAAVRECIKAINQELPAYKRIQKIKFRDTEFEKTNTKKIKRFQ